MSDQVKEVEKQYHFKFTNLEMINIIEAFYTRGFSKDKVCRMLFDGRVKK
jgi:hypothetical protein